MENLFVRQFCYRRTLQSQHEQNDISRATNNCEKCSKWSFHVTIWTYSECISSKMCFFILLYTTVLWVSCNYMDIL
uniref:Uncharacterized protein n=1 Tax=Setaria viridis TaxID=4556 RepID=A0A4U6TC50_SETVI|nr:hypothetical protein SEVIR_8G056632v2 [Setaria viridis]